MIKTFVTGLVLKNENAQKKSKILLKILFIFPADCFNVFKPIEDPISLGYLSDKLKTLILETISLL